jgi:hypothetical protein
MNGNGLNHYTIKREVALMNLVLKQLQLFLMTSATELTGRNAELNNLETTEGFPTKFQKIIKGGDY